MTKRYFVSGYAVWDSYNNDRRVDTRSKPICDLLNQLSDENEKLNHRLAISEKANFVTTLEKEHERLKLELGTYKEANKTLKQTIDRLLQDNLKLKNKLKEEQKEIENLKQALIRSAF